MSTELAINRDSGGDSRVLSSLARGLEHRGGVALGQVLSVAQLYTRFDLKYLVPVEALPTLIDRLPRQLAALDIDGLRIFRYESVYFDTDDFALYRHHVQDRRKRYKARTRSYCDSADTMLDVKLKGPRGQTVKQRLPYDFERRYELTVSGRGFLDMVIADAYGTTGPPLRTSLTTGYRRATLVDLEHQTRLTIDVNLSWSDEQSNHRANHLALIESKSPCGRRPVDALLGSIAVRPVRMSKYCVGVALLHPDLAANPWNRLLRRQFGWERAADSCN